MAELILDEREVVIHKIHLFRKVKDAAGEHPGPVSPSTADQALFTQILFYFFISVTSNFIL